MIPNITHSAEGVNVRLIGRSDLQGRESLQVTLRGNYAYVGHHKGDEFNPLTERIEPNGTTILNVSDPFRPKEVGHFVPETTDKTKPRLSKVIQTNDVDLDYRGLIYITDRAGAGLHILEYTGNK